MGVQSARGPSSFQAEVFLKPGRLPAASVRLTWLQVAAEPTVIGVAQEDIALSTIPGTLSDEVRHQPSRTCTVHGIFTACEFILQAFMSPMDHGMCTMSERSSLDGSQRALQEVCLLPPTLQASPVSLPPVVLKGSNTTADLSLSLANLGNATLDASIEVFPRLNAV